MFYTLENDIREIINKVDLPHLEKTDRPDIFAIAENLGFKTHANTELDLPDLIIENSQRGWIKTSPFQSSYKDEFQIARTLVAALHHRGSREDDISETLRFHKLPVNIQKEYERIARILMFPDEVFITAWENNIQTKSNDDDDELYWAIAANFNTLPHYVKERAKDLNCV